MNTVPVTLPGNAHFIVDTGMVGSELMTPLHHYPDTTWTADGPTRGVEAVVEAGAVLVFPQLPFVLSEAEIRFLDPRWADGRAKNISLRWGDSTGRGGPGSSLGSGLGGDPSGDSGSKPSSELRGATGDVAALDALHHMIGRYADQAETLALRLFPHYRGHLRRGNTSFRPVDVAGRTTGWRQDDTRLHIDAFPSNPLHGTRLLRVFCNVNPNGQVRRWRVGEHFEDHARRWLPSIARPLPGSAWLLEKARVTKRRRTEYDHLMLQLHDRAKADTDFQRNGPQADVAFAPGTTWVVFSDQVPHAAMGGQHLLEQTFYLDPAQQLRPETSPRGTLERLTGRSLG